MTWQQRIDSALARRRENNSFRTRQANQQGSGRYLVQNDIRYLNFSSNDYLGISHHAEVVNAWQQGAEIYGIGSGGSGHVTGYHEAHQRFEQSFHYQRPPAYILQYGNPHLLRPEAKHSWQ